MMVEVQTLRHRENTDYVLEEKVAKPTVSDAPAVEIPVAHVQDKKKVPEISTASTVQISNKALTPMEKLLSEMSQCQARIGLMSE